MFVRLLLLGSVLPISPSTAVRVLAEDYHMRSSRYIQLHVDSVVVWGMVYIMETCTPLQSSRIAETAVY